MEYRDYYQTLGVERDATEAEIKRAYRKLARKYHPDVSSHGNAEQRFKEIGEAYKVLKNPETRAAYDQLGSNWKQGQDFKPPPGWNAGFEFSGAGPQTGGRASFSDFFQQMFGDIAGDQGHRGAGFRGRGEDHHAKVLIDLEDAYQGTSRVISLRVPEIDSSGHTRTTKRSLSVRIPRGIAQGQRIRLAGQGAPGPGGGRAGDLYLEVEFKPHRIYRVDNRDVFVDLPLAPWEAAMGGKVNVPTPAGSVELSIPPGSSGGQKLRLSGRGIPGKKPGDFFAVLRIALPPADSEEAKALYRKMQQTLAFNPRERLGV